MPSRERSGALSGARVCGGGGAWHRQVLGAQPKLKENLNEILSRVEKLFKVEEWDRSAMKGFTKPSEPGLFTFELPQVTST